MSNSCGAAEPSTVLQAANGEPPGEVAGEAVVGTGAQKPRFNWTGHPELANLIAEQAQRLGHLRGGTGVAGGFAELQRLVTDLNARRAAEGQPAIVIPSDLTVSVYQTRFTRSGKGKGAQPAAAAAVAAAAPAAAAPAATAPAAAAPAAAAQAATQQQLAPEQTGQQAAARTKRRGAGSKRSRDAAADDGDASGSEQQDVGGYDLDGADRAAKRYCQGIHKFLEAHPFAEVFVAISIPSKPLLVDGGSVQIWLQPLCIAALLCCYAAEVYSTVFLETDMCACQFCHCRGSILSNPVAFNQAARKFQGVHLPALKLACRMHQVVWDRNTAACRGRHATWSCGLLLTRRGNKFTPISFTFFLLGAGP
jgi:hypothetical protein